MYECADGAFVSIGAIEPQFYAELLERTGLSSDPAFAAQNDKAAWPALKVKVAEMFRTKSRQEWCTLLETTDVCFAPVLSMTDAAAHPHNVERGTFVEYDGRVQPSPAPRFSRTAAAIDAPPPRPGEHTREILDECGFDGERVEALLASRAASQAG